MPPSLQPTTLIDVHSHALLSLGRAAPMSDRYRPQWSPEAALAFMDEHGVTACVLTVPDAANDPSDRDARQTARRVNEALAEIVSRHPERFCALATLPGGDADGCLEEISYALDELGFDGASTSTSVGDDYLGEPVFDPWLQELARRQATLFIHPTVPPAATGSLLGLHPSVVEYMFQTTRMLTNMVITGAARRFSAIRMISTHAGGTLPFLARRIETLEHTFGVGEGRLELSAAQLREGFASFYYDLTAATTDEQLTALRALVPSSQILMGLDFPFMPADSFAPALRQFAETGLLDDADREAIASANALTLFPRLAERLGS